MQVAAFIKPNRHCLSVRTAACQPPAQRRANRQVLLGTAPAPPLATEKPPAAARLPQVRASDEEAEGLPPPAASRLLKRLALQAREAFKAPRSAALAFLISGSAVQGWQGHSESLAIEHAATPVIPTRALHACLAERPRQRLRGHEGHARENPRRRPRLTPRPRARPSSPGGPPNVRRKHASRTPRA